MRKLISIILLSATSLGVYALGLGNIELNSDLNQPFDARIELLSPTPSEMSTLAVRLAGAEAFSRAGIERSFILTTLQFEVVESETGSDYIHITTREPVREPFLNFLLEASWSNGRLYREYTVLIDPPLYDSYAGGPSTSESAVVSSGRSSSVEPAQAPAPATPPRTFSTFSGSEFGPVSQVDTLWSIANQVRPDSSVSTQQMMLALLRANPEAFISNNINGLRQGQILRIPERDDIVQTSPEQAFTEVRSQNAMWEDMRGAIADSTAQRPSGASSQPAGGTSSASVQNEAELRLVSPGDDDNGGQAGGTSSAAGDANLALMEEQINTLSAENTDLQDRLAENEALIDDLRRLIELKDDELAVLQQQIAAEGEELPVPEQTTDETTVADNGEMPVTPDTDDVEPAAPVEEEEMPPAVTPPAPAPVQTTGMFDQILGLVMGNIIVIGGAVGLALLLGLFMYARSKKSDTADEATEALSDFPDFEGTADETEMPEAGGPEISSDADSAPASNDFDVEIDTSETGEDAAEQPAEISTEDSGDDADDADVADEDPLAEVNVFLAYEHFDQAEEFVRDAIKKSPDNLDFHSKLLEVFYSSGDKVKYEEEAKELHELVNGEGPHWEMATIMWQEMSPNRALFEEADDEDDDAGEDITSSRGIVDLTADESDAGGEDEDDAGLDFDLGTDADDKKSEAGSEADDVLDITAGSEDVLDVTAAASGDTADEEDMLDVTAAVGLGSTDDTDSSEEVSLGSGAESDDDILDISAAGGDDMLDITAASTGNESDDGAADAEQTGSTEKEDDNSLDFDIGDMDLDKAGGDESVGEAQTPSDDENMIDFDLPETGDNAGDSALESEAENNNEDDGINIDFDNDYGTEQDDSSGLKLDSSDDDGDVDTDSEEVPDETMEINLDSGGDDSDDDGGIELDLGSGDDSTDESEGLGLDDADGIPEIEFDSGSDEVTDETMEISLDTDSSDSDDDDGIELDFGDDSASEDDKADAGIELEDENSSSDKLDIESTVKLQRNTLGLVDDDDENDNDHTVFVPRTSDSGEQSSEDEIATKLDLAKAYVELGDGESAKSILEEIIAEGNDSQRQRAQELMGQIS